MKTALINGRVFVDGKFVSDHAVIIENGLIKAVAPIEDASEIAAVHDLKGALLAPGFIDIQVNGGGGYLFNDAPTVDTIREIGRTHRNYGTTGFLPTLISDDLDVIERAIKAVDDAIKIGVPGVLGIHIEGPFLSTDRKGVHDPYKFRRLNKDHIPLLTSLKHGKTLVTIAPENAHPGLISMLRDRGVIVSAGHTNADYAMACDALQRGVTGFTHLFNAMSPITSREPGVVGAALEHQKSWCGIIVDGRHVSPTSLNLALRCKPADKFILVTDAMPTVGMTEKAFSLQGRSITVKDGVCVADNGTLAGSDLDMAQAVRNAYDLLDVDLPQALNMASQNPAAFLGLQSEYGAIAPGHRASLVALDETLQTVETWIDGDKSYAAPASGSYVSNIAQFPIDRRQRP